MEKFGMVTFDRETKPESLVEKPTALPSPWAVIGLYMMDRRALVPTAELEIVHLLRRYLEEGTLRAELLGRGSADMVNILDRGQVRQQ